MEAKRKGESKLKSHGKHKYKLSYGNVNEGHGFTEERKRKVKREYFKLQKKIHQVKPTEDVKSSIATVQPSHDSPLVNTPADMVDDRDGIISSKGKKSMNKFSRAEAKFQKQKAKEDVRKQEVTQNRQATESHLQQYKDRKKQRNRKMSIRTPKGQPIMKYQIKSLLQQIESQVGNR